MVPNLHGHYQGNVRGIFYHCRCSCFANPDMNTVFNDGKGKFSLQKEVGQSRNQPIRCHTTRLVGRVVAGCFRTHAGSRQCEYI